MYIMDRKEKKVYKSPRLTTVVFRTERGYAASLTNDAKTFILTHK